MVARFAVTNATAAAVSTRWHRRGGNAAAA